MGKFGNAAVLATNIIIEDSDVTPRFAWQMAVENIFPDSASSRKKGCPKNAYLGLCENGEISGIPLGEYTNSRANKDYALKALELLRRSPELKADQKLL